MKPGNLATWFVKPTLLALIKKASEYKAFNSLSYADCIAAATTKINKGILVTGDREFLKLKDEIKIEWL